MQQETLDQAAEFISRQSEETKIYIGTDSKRKLAFPKVYNVIFTTVIICHIDGSKGCKVFADVELKRDYRGDIQARLLEEVDRAIQCHQGIKYSVGDREIQIHLDINSNPRYKSNSVAKAAQGWVKGVCGIDAVLKPHSFAASTAADMYHQKFGLWEGN
jgi:uncharacterized protein